MLVVLTAMQASSTVLVCLDRILNLYLGTYLRAVASVQKAVESYVATAYTSVADSFHTSSEK